ncbi:ABC transporter substrate-binding protein [Lederbergia lenta]|uniref:Oligopeptide ABC transporter substrate-binding protein n=1 Tax=Lederbergia lenta TaxID=1467 RepID=A0A2X4VXG0_LEDLE|nr:ABC transporter substrate-binding protein [Lederbergia lenta]MCM3111219.1 ABC transporter substrate-binding protein [Lederbergia lenta]MEC2325393.1 ABC transporter substrate-binding protein [Lederbergia lenta]SQI55541.1 oligopeptide ABC transporter substrate-binding protein [Lederbergia lenta]
MRISVKSSFIFLLLFSMIIVGCSPKSDPTVNKEKGDQKDEGNKETKVVDVSEISEFHQAPMLDDMDLPDVKDRIPLEPKIPNEMPHEFLTVEIGKYGGTLNTVAQSVNWDPDLFVMSNEPLLNTPGILGEEVTANVLKDYEVTDDQKVFTFYMREGLKWSDGEPVTTEDVRFAIEDVQFNEEIMPILPAWLHSGGNVDGSPMELEIVDEFTFKISFAESNGGFPISLAIQNWRGYADLLKPAHYLKQFHKDYAEPAELEKLIAEHDFEEDQETDWVNFFNYMDINEREMSHSNAVGFPVLYPWMLTEMTKTHGLYDRNPYYFKVDAEGNQLPYIDSIKSAIVQDTEVTGLKVIAGEVDFNREATALAKMPVYRENAEKGGYEAILANMHLTPTDIFLNLTYDDPVWREVVNDLRFRQALNYAIDRDEVIDTLYFGFADPSEVIDSTFNLEKANALLDDMGMKKGADGFRIGPDGKRFSIPFEVQAAAPDIVPLAELLTEMWKEIGIHVTVKTIDGTLWSTRNTANELQASIIWTHTPLYYMQDWGQGFWGPLWDKWWKSGGKNGEEPPEDVKEYYSLMDKMNVSPPEEALEIMDTLRGKMKDNIYYFVHIENAKQPMIVNAKIGNITDKGTAISINFAGEQWFFKE